MTVLAHPDAADVNQASLRDARVLVTGAAGFLGSHLCRHLIAEGAEVHGVSRSQRESQVGLRWINAELSDPRATSQLVASTRPDLIIHLGGHVTAAPDMSAVRPTFESLLVSAVNVLIAASEAGCRRTILPGSMIEPPSDEVNFAPMSPYMAAKWTATAYARMFHSLYGSPIVIVRPSMTYGPGQPPARLVAYVIRTLLRGEAPVLSSGTLEADWAYVDDITTGILAAARAPGIEGLTIDLGTGRVATVREVVETIVDILGTSVRPIFGALPDRPGERVYAADPRLARERLGWSATTDLREGLRRTIEWYAAG